MEFEILCDYNHGKLGMVDIAEKYGKSIGEVVDIIHYYKVERKLNKIKGK